MSTALPAIMDSADTAIVRQADTDRQLIAMWIAATRARTPAETPSARPTGFSLSWTYPCPTSASVTCGRSWHAGRSGPCNQSQCDGCAQRPVQLRLAQTLGYVPFNVGKAIKTPSVKNTLAERIMLEADTMRMIALESNLRNRALLTLTCGAGLRISEVCGLKWRDLAARHGGAGQERRFQP